LESAFKCFEKPLAEIYTILLEELLQVVIQMLGGGHLLLNVASKSDQNGTMIFKSGDCAGQGRC
jgi:hypothetical protein